MEEKKLKYWYGRYVDLEEWESMYGKKGAAADELPSHDFLKEAEEKLLGEEK